MDLKSYQHAFSSDGICQLTGLLDAGALRAMQRSYVAFCTMQATKLGLDVSHINPDSIEDVNRLVQSLNERDRWALDQAGAMARNSSAGLSLASNGELLQAAATLLNCPLECLVISGPSFFVNLPAKKIRLYTWHSERYWYPKRRNFINAWIPLFADKRDENGTMSVLPGSHTREWTYFSEYFGYDQDTQGNTECNLQYEIPECELTGFPPRTVRARLGDVVLFHSNLVHRSNENLSKSPSFALSIRIFDYRRDLTVSGNWTESPYRLSDPQQHGGRYNLKPANIE